MFRILTAFTTSFFILASAANAQTAKENIKNGMAPEHSNKLHDDNIIHSTTYAKTDAQLQRLNEQQYKVTQHNGTEPPFKNEYWNNWADGIYVDVVTGEPLFSSTDKYNSGNGWPSFRKPINENFVSTMADESLGFTRIEVRSKNGDSHLGHILDDAPDSEGGRHFCINSSALRFVPKEEMKKAGYGEYLSLFDKP